MSDPHEDGRHISKIETLWPVVRQAHDGAPEEAAAAQRQLLDRYRAAIDRYLHACLDDYGAEEVAQEFSLRFIRGDFRNADPEKGRFRDLLKSALYHLIIDHQKKRSRAMRQLSPDAPEPVAAQASTFDGDRQFLAQWRLSLLGKAWEALAQDERESGRPVHTVLHFPHENPGLRSHQMAAELSSRLGKSLSAEWVRKWIHAGRDKFAEFLLVEVAASIQKPTGDELEQELIDLELYQYCKSALDRWREEAEAR